MKQVELAQKLGVSKSYLSMMLSGQRRIPGHFEKPISELVHKNQLQEVPSKQRVAGSNPARDATSLKRAAAFTDPRREGPWFESTHSPCKK